MTTNVVPSGTIEVLSGDTMDFPTGLSGTGELLLDGNALALVHGPVTVGEVVIAGADSVIRLYDHTVHFNTASIAQDGFLQGSGGFLGTITNHGEIFATGGLLTLGAVSGTGGVLVVDTQASLELRCATTSPVIFEGGNASLLLDKPSEFSGNLVNMAVTDSLVFKNAAVSSATVHAGVLTVLGAGGSLVAALQLTSGTGVPVPTSFGVSPDGHTVTAL